MIKIQSLRIISILGAFLVGYWLPIRLIGYHPPIGVEVFFDLLVSVVAGINIYLHFQKPYTNYKDKRSWLNIGLFFDLVCLLPLSLLSLSFGQETSEWILYFNLLCARHVRHIKPFLDEFDSLQPITYRLIPIFISLPLLVHLVACGWIVLGGGSAGIDPDPVFNYVRALYWAFTTLTTVGYGDITAKTISQMLFASGVQVTGVAVFGYILSNVASLLGRMDANREHHMDSLDRIETFMQTHHIPGDLRSSTRAFYHYLWKSKKGYHDRTLLDQLPSKLQSELLLFINKSIVEKVPFLKNASSDTIEDLMQHLEPRIFVPGEKIFKIDEPGDAIYFIHSGEVEIQNREHKTLAILKDGAFFGEMALLNDQPRSATAKAVHFCDIYFIRKKEFLAVIQSYPEFRTHIESVMHGRSVA